MRLIENESRLVGMKFEMLVELSPKRSGAGLDTFDIPGAQRRGTGTPQVDLSEFCLLRIIRIDVLCSNFFLKKR